MKQVDQEIQIREKLKHHKYTFLEKIQHSMKEKLDANIIAETTGIYENVITDSLIVRLFFSTLVLRQTQSSFLTFGLRLAGKNLQN